MNKVEEIKKAVQEINKELCDLIGDRTIELTTEDIYNEDKISYFVGSEQYNVKSVCVNRYNSILVEKQKILAFNVDLVTVDIEGNIETYDDHHTLEELPFDVALNLLEYVYNVVIGADTNGN